jgi:cytidylate kinase
MEPDREHHLDFTPPPAEAGESPRHGFQGDRRPPPPPSGIPAGLTIAISREAGARGGTIGRRVARKLGWQVFDQELLEYTAQEGTFRQDFTENLSPEALRWAEDRLQELLRAEQLSQHPSIVNLARVVLALGAQGEVVLIGRGAGCILPPPNTLHVRIVAPLSDRIAYLAQWERLTVEEAAERVRLRDNRRAEFITTHFHRQPTDPYQYDLLMNSSLLGEELCADLIAESARAKWIARSEAASGL